MLFESTWERLGVWQKANVPFAESPAKEESEEVPVIRRETTPALTQRSLDFEAFEQWQKDEARRKVNDLTVEPEEW